jgi:cyclophilin family peptidyl-prolyl cis-trans isomerase
LNKKHVVFGKVIEGQDVIKALEVIGNDDGKTSKKAVIVSCGTID